MANPEHVKIVKQGADATREWWQRSSSDQLDLSRANLRGTDLSGADPNGADLTGADLTGADLTGANLDGASLCDASLCGANLCKAIVRNANLRNANLRNANLRNANLRNANLRNANLRNANLRNANLRNANLRNANLRNANLRNANLRGANLSETDLSDADSVGADFTDAKLKGAKIEWWADLQEAILARADLTDTKLTGVKLTRANLRGANLSWADLRWADLRGADLTSADLCRVNLCEARLTGAILGGAEFDATVLSDVDLSEVNELEAVEHRGRSTIGVDTLMRSKGQIPEEFLRECGLSPWQILEAKLHDPALTAAQISDLQYKIFNLRAHGPLYLGGVFISYSHADAKFVDKLYRRLLNEGVSVWLDRHDLVAGSLDKQVARSIRFNDVVLLVLSDTSIRSEWVENELEIARRKENEEKRDVLCPVALDDSWKVKLEDEVFHRKLWRTITDRHIVDFSDWQTEDTFNMQFGKLLRGMKIYYEPKKG